MRGFTWKNQSKFADLGAAGAAPTWSVTWQRLGLAVEMRMGSTYF